MSRDLTLQCLCGNLQGRILSIKPSRGTRLVCHCLDCQAFAHFTGVDGVMDTNGGTEIFQTLPGRVVFDKGETQLRALHLADRGLLRWCAKCCGTPMGNMLHTPAIRFVGLPTIAIPKAEDRAAMGPNLASLDAKFARPGSTPPADFGLKTARRRGILRHLASKMRLAPAGSPYFRDNGTPIVAPYILSAEEHAAAYDGLSVN